MLQRIVCFTISSAKSCYISVGNLKFLSISQSQKKAIKLNAVLFLI